ncbi:MAG: serine/threonine protein kinase [Chloroflexaceae bacterium]|nr:serine/threonine protein kinase [Chloroflexaceae bacterium]
MVFNTISGDDYDMIEQLHEGRNALVYRARRRTNGIPIILKALKEIYPLPERIALFRREYEIMRSLVMAGVPRVYSLETNQRRWFLTMEDTRGESLTRLGLAGNLSLGRFLDLAIQMVTVLGNIHRRRVIHRDINPSNVIFSPATRQVRLIDFGLATMLSQEDQTFQNPALLEGTLAYMSPEQTGRMNRSIDYRTDFYSLGVTWYELLTGQLPFASPDALELIHSHIARSPPPHTNSWMLSIPTRWRFTGRFLPSS